MAAAIGTSMRAVGVHQGLAPVLDVTRDARWGRTEETIGEDPYLVGTIGTAYVTGLQSAGVHATLKHFAGYSASRARPQHGPRGHRPAGVRRRHPAPVRDGRPAGRRPQRDALLHRRGWRARHRGHQAARRDAARHAGLRRPGRVRLLRHLVPGVTARGRRDARRGRGPGPGRGRGHGAAQRSVLRRAPARRRRGRRGHRGAGGPGRGPGAPAEVRAGPARPRLDSGAGHCLQPGPGPARESRPGPPPGRGIGDPAGQPGRRAADRPDHPGRGRRPAGR